MNKTLYKSWLGCPKMALLQDRQRHSQRDNFRRFQKCLQIVQGQLLGHFIMILQGKVGLADNKVGNGTLFPFVPNLIQSSNRPFGLRYGLPNKQAKDKGGIQSNQV